jgi:hypothetical protein
MSHTQRYYPGYRTQRRGRYYVVEQLNEEELSRFHCRTARLASFYGVPQRDEKPGQKPPHLFKQFRSRRERARAKLALRQDAESIPVFRRSDQYEWS